MGKYYSTIDLCRNMIAEVSLARVLLTIGCHKWHETSSQPGRCSTGCGSQDNIYPIVTHALNKCAKETRPRFDI